MNLLLDTCAFIWLVNGDPALSLESKAAIQAAWKVHVSAVTAWEMGIKHAKGRLMLNESLELWFERAFQRHDIAALPLDVRSSIRASRLPAIHADPADRLLIATAIEHDLTFVTPDLNIQRYQGLKTIW